MGRSEGSERPNNCDAGLEISSFTSSDARIPVYILSDDF